MVLVLTPLQVEAETESHYQIVQEPYLAQITPAETMPSEHPKKVLPGRNIAGNCVLYVRSVRSDLPRGLWTLESKKRIVKTDKPSINAVAVTGESYAGHVAIVREINDDKVLVEESGYSYGVTKRWVNVNKIIGYF